MRPVQLDMTGFASFREEATLDFTDVDYFALVGATGAGKSTIIDALTFALYGTVDRWGDKKAIRYALAPTSNQAKVRLVFDIGNARYVVAREVRRSPQGIVNQRSAVLEQLPSQCGIGGVDDPPAAVIADGSKVTDTVSKILGLSLDDFSKCVVLPQGKFSEFLNASQSQRREILLKLLGGDHYDLMARRANERQADAAATYTQLLNQQADLPATTQADLDSAIGRGTALEVLNSTVDDSLKVIRTTLREHHTTTAALTKAEADLTLLCAVHVPDSVGDLAQRAQSTTAAHTAALGTVKQARTLDETRRQDLAGHPERRDMEITRDHHDEVAQLQTTLPGLEQAATTAVQDAADAAAARARADEIRDAARRGADTTAQTRKDTAADVARLTQQRGLLEQVRLPAGVDELDRRIKEAAAEHQRAAAARDAAEVHDTTARGLVHDGDVVRLTSLLRSVDALNGATADLQKATGDLTAAQTALTAAQADEQQHERVADDAANRYAEVAARHQASDLRAHLEVGGPCPVCDQRVAQLPADLDVAELTAARSAREQSLADLKAAKDRTATAADQHLNATVHARTTTSHYDRLVAELDTPTPARSDLEAGLVAAQAAQADAKAAADAYAAARKALQAAAAARQSLEDDHSTARIALRSARRPLAALTGCPDVDGVSIADGWHTLLTWARDTSDELDSTLLPAAHRADTDAAAAVESATAADEAARQSYTDAVRAYDRATQTSHRATETHRTTTARLTALTDTLAAAPSRRDIEGLLEARRTAETAVAESTTALATAQRAADDAAQAADAAREEMATAQRELSSARDPLVSLGAPPISDAALDTAWGRLATWASEQRTTLAATGNALRAAANESEQTRTRHLDMIRVALDAHDVDVARLTRQPATPSAATGLASEMGLVDEELLADINSAIDVAKVRATQRVIECEHHLAKAAELTARVHTAAEEKDVAALLSKLLSAGNFRDWLASTALDSLVEAASDSLRELSGSQYDLTQRNNEFHVIDHFDADSTRPVKTLSGGETFQASLALALALSGQMSTLAAGGTAQLESIFLDEGFGTLDPDALDLVASTLETLSQGRRMVGVVTHVAALAERAPVRFHVTRDGRTSSVTKESL